MTQTTVAGLTLDAEYDFFVVGLNGDDYDEGEASDLLVIKAAALPDAPGAITEVQRIEDAIELTWVASASNGGSAILGYVLY